MENKVRKKLNEFFNDKIFIDRNTGTLIFTYKLVNSNLEEFYYGFTQVKCGLRKNFDVVLINSFMDFLNRDLICNMPNYSKSRSFIDHMLLDEEFGKTDLISIPRYSWIIELKGYIETKLKSGLYSVPRSEFKYMDRIEWLMSRYLGNEEI